MIDTRKHGEFVSVNQMSTNISFLVLYTTKTINTKIIVHYVNKCKLTHKIIMFV